MTTKISKKHMKTMLSVAMAMIMLIASSSVAFAADTTSTGEGSIEATVPVNGSIKALTISVTHPASVEYVINPNLGYEAGAFVAPNIAITNNTPVPVNVTIGSLTSAIGGTLQFTDVASDAKDWANLGLTDSKAFIALGVKVTDGTGWGEGYDTNAHYAVDISDTALGTLDASATGKMTMLANYGLSFDQNYTAIHSLVLMFNLV